MAIKRKFPVRVATVYCRGGCRAAKKQDYTAESCEQAAALCPGGPLVCEAGCLGCGTCVRACRFGAIALNEYGVAEVDEEKCLGCGACARKCPRGLIRLRLKDEPFAPLCSNTDRGPDARKACEASCIACGLCVKKCPADAIRVENFHAVIDESKCLSCGMCAVNCPRGVIADRRGVLAAPR